MKQAITLSVFKLTAVAGLTLFAAAETYAASVASGFDAEALLKGAVRYRHMNSNGMQKEIYIGVPPLDTAANRNTGDVSWGTGKHVLFTYSAGVLSTTVGTGLSAVTVTPTGGSLGELNYILINVQRNQMMGGGMGGGGMMHGPIEFKNVKLNGTSLAPDSFVGEASGAKWNVTGEILSDGFTMEGDIVLSGMQPGMDMNHVELSVGYTDQTGPQVTSIAVDPNPAILNGTTSLRATVDDAAVGNHPIQSAEYRLNDGPWTALAAQDGAFDAVSEDVEAELPATQLGSNEVCVRGTDSKGNVTNPPTCTTFMVTYQFEGFFEPINNSLLNTAKAGQAVPTKWRLTDALGAPIEDQSSFAGLYSYPVDCESLMGNAADAIEEYAPGNSGLQYKGDGNWQYNWKTPKTYAGTCRALYVEFDSETVSPAIVTFQFK